MTVSDTGELGLDGQEDWEKRPCREIVQGADLQMKNHLDEYRNVQETAMESERS